MGTDASKDVFDHARDITGKAGGILGRAAKAVGGAAANLKDRLDGPDSFDEGLTALVEAFRTKSVTNAEMATALRAKADELG